MHGSWLRCWAIWRGSEKGSLKLPSLRLCNSGKGMDGTDGRVSQSEGVGKDFRASHLMVTLDMEETHGGNPMECGMKRRKNSKRWGPLAVWDAVHGAW
jgi:hypothetical protein